MTHVFLETKNGSLSNLHLYNSNLLVLDKKFVVLIIKKNIINIYNFNLGRFTSGGISELITT